MRFLHSNSEHQGGQFPASVKVADLDGADVISIEGLGTPENPHLIQEAFAIAGAVQCGFCTPGMIMATKALLDINPDPTLS